jgi:predicted cytidylate kinase
MVIRVSGHPGAGKTTLCKRLAAALGYEYHYAGGIFRQMAAERGLSIEDFYAALAADPAAENAVDERQERLMAEKDNLVMEGRIAPFLPCPFPTCNILLTVEPRTGAARNAQRPENTGRSIEDMEARTQERLEAERNHYRALRGIEDHLDPSRFDIVIDTTTLTPDEVFSAVMNALRPRL